jgi:hypothetical protein
MFTGRSTRSGYPLPLPAEIAGSRLSLIAPTGVNPPDTPAMLQHPDQLNRMAATARNRAIRGQIEPRLCRIKT